MINNAAIESYSQKFQNLLQSYSAISDRFDQIKAIAEEQHHKYWISGAWDGALITFVTSLEDEEHDISNMIYAKISKSSDKVTINSYIDAALVVLKELGHEIILPEE